MRQMEVLILIGVVWGIGFLINIFSKGTSSGNQTTNRTSSPSPPPSRPQPSQPKNQTIYRPQTTHKGGIVFKPLDTSGSIEKIDLSGVNDAFTGAPLNPSLGLFQCTTCKVFYHQESYDLLVEVNSAKCVSCSNATIRSLTETEAKKSERRNYDPNIITLEKVKQNVGRVITFEGYVHDVKVSRRGSDYAVMFEDKSWTGGFKLVFFRKAAARIGASYILRLKGRTIRVRGLIVHDKKFGYQMIISEKSMIVRD